MMTVRRRVEIRTMKKGQHLEDRRTPQQQDMPPIGLIGRSI